jgi:hypothetical protein
MRRCGCLLSPSPVDIATARQERVVAPTTSRSTRLSYGYDPRVKVSLRIQDAC